MRAIPRIVLIVKGAAIVPFVRFFRAHRLAGVAFAAAVVTGAVLPAAAAPHDGDLAPSFTLPKATGGSLTLSQYRGKAVYLNFFASWCGPCNSEAATVAQLYAKYHRRGLMTIGVNEQEDKSKALGFARKYKWPFAIALDDGNMGKDYGAIGLPIHVFIDKSGKISTYRLGEMSRDEIEDALKKIL